MTAPVLFNVTSALSLRSLRKTKKVRPSFEDDPTVVSSDSESESTTKPSRARTPAGQLPPPTPLSSNHHLVNLARAQYGLESLFRSRELDELARKKAQQLADKATLEETPREVLIEELKENLVAENVQRGPTMRGMHKLCVQSKAYPSNKKNMYSKLYNEMGMGTARSSVDGRLYMVQYFRYNHEEIEDQC